ncbi:MAG: choice-of-anchor D domain-containing protein, partial [Gemmatimonadetes bacterium]|nr:choice-of-anchor D domain-containing protein [Gemmatimonadota bacterium]
FLALPAAFAVARGDTQRVDVTFLRAAPGQVQENLLIHCNDPESPVVSVRLSGKALSPVLAVASEAVSFDDVSFDELPRVGQREVRELTIANKGDGPLRIASLSVGGAAFSVMEEAAKVEAGETLQVQVLYTPQEAGEHEGVLPILSNDLEQPRLQVALSGATLGSRGPKIEADDGLDLGTVLLGNSGGAELTIRNSGDEELAIGLMSVDNDRFGLEEEKLVIPAGGSRGIPVTFVPDLVRVETGTLTLRSDDPLRPLVQVALAGRGEIPPEGQVSMDFHLASGDQGVRAVGGAEPGRVYGLQLHVNNAPAISGWSVTIEYDHDQVRYVKDSFQASGFIPGLVELVDEKSGTVSIGGTVLEADEGAAGDHALGMLSFELLEGFAESTDLVVQKIGFRRPDGSEEVFTVHSVATITSQALTGMLVGDFDGNDVVDFSDFFLFADHFMGDHPLYDLDGSGLVDFDDFFIFADHFGQEAGGG